MRMPDISCKVIAPLSMFWLVLNDADAEEAVKSPAKAVPAERVAVRAASTMTFRERFVFMRYVHSSYVLYFFMKAMQNKYPPA